MSCQDGELNSCEIWLQIASNMALWGFYHLKERWTKNAQKPARKASIETHML